MATISMTEAREGFADLCNRVAYRHETIGISKHGKIVAALIPVQNRELLEKIEQLIDLDLSASALAESRRAGTTSLGDMARKIGIDVNSEQPAGR